MAQQLGHYPAGMERGGSDAAIAQAPIEFDGEQDVGGLRSAIADKGTIFGMFEAGIVEIDVGGAMRGR